MNPEMFEPLKFDCLVFHHKNCKFTTIKFSIFILILDETTPKSNLPNGDIGSAVGDIRRNPSGSGEPATITPTTPQLMSPTFKVFFLFLIGAPVAQWIKRWPTDLVD